MPPFQPAFHRLGHSQHRTCGQAPFGHFARFPSRTPGLPLAAQHRPASPSAIFSIDHQWLGACQWPPQPQRNHERGKKSPKHLLFQGI